MSRLLLLLLLLPGLAFAQASDDTVRAGQIQVQAREAFEAGELDDALRLANRAIALDSGPSTWLGQQIRVEVLEQQGQLEQAMTHLEAYLALDGLFPEHLAWGDEARGRLRGALRDAGQRNAALEQQARTQTGVGIGLLVGGAVPLAIGVGHAVNYGVQGGNPDTHGGWLDSGLVLIGVGAGLEVAGALLVALAPKGRAVTLAPAGPGLLLAGRF